MNGHVFVLGATGTVGRLLLDELAPTDVAVRAAARNPAKAAAAYDVAVQWAEFDLERVETFAPALAGIDRVFMISRPGDDVAERFAVPFIDAMRVAGVKHVVNLSAMGAAKRPEFSVRKVELALEASGIPFTHLRPNFFMQIHATGALGQAIRMTRRIALPAGNAKLSFIDARDVAGVAARVLTDVRPHANSAYTLTGCEAMDYHEVADCIAKAVGDHVQYVPIDDAATRAMLQGAGYAATRIDRLLGMYRLVRMGACEPTSPDAEAVLTHPPIRFDKFAADHADCWK